MAFAKQHGRVDVNIPGQFQSSSNVQENQDFLLVMSNVTTKGIGPLFGLDGRWLLDKNKKWSIDARVDVAYIPETTETSYSLNLIDATAEVIVTSRQGGDPKNVALAASGIVAASSAAVVAVVPDTADVALPLAFVRSTAVVMSAGAVASALVLGSDRIVERAVGKRGLPTNLAVAAGLGAAAAGVRVALRNRRAGAQGEAVAP